MKLSKYKRKRKLRFNKKKFILSFTTLVIFIFVISIPIKKFFSESDDKKNSSAYAVAKSVSTSKSSKNDSSKNDTESKTNVSKVSNAKDTATTDRSSNSSINWDKPIDKNLFSNSLFIGDSVTEGLSFYEILDEKNVSGFKGFSLAKAVKDIDKVLKLQAKNIFILLGSNDLEGNINTTTFTKQYKTLVDKIQQKLPNANIFLESITCVTDKVSNSNKLLSNSRINNFNKIINNIAKEKNVTYLDLSNIFNNVNYDLHEKDGIHFKTSFYNFLLKYLQNYIK